MVHVLEGRGIKRDYHIPGGLFTKAKTVHAVKGVSFKVDQGKTLAIVGESGCGKSTLARIITLIDPASAGDLLIEGKKVDLAKGDLTRKCAARCRSFSRTPMVR
jgi:dipeptide transport system ATP-binding protein